LKKGVKAFAPPTVKPFDVFCADFESFDEVIPSALMECSHEMYEHKVESIGVL
jgi:hypothetical protein